MSEQESRFVKVEAALAKQRDARRRVRYGSWVAAVLSGVVAITGIIISTSVIIWTDKEAAEQEFRTEPIWDSANIADFFGDQRVVDMLGTLTNRTHPWFFPEVSRVDSMMSDEYTELMGEIHDIKQRLRDLTLVSSELSEVLNPMDDRQLFTLLRLGDQVQAMEGSIAESRGQIRDQFGDLQSDHERSYEDLRARIETVHDMFWATLAAIGTLTVAVMGLLWSGRPVNRTEPHGKTNDD